jgi:hypothetical protein
MQIEQTRWNHTTGWETQPGLRLGSRAQLVLLFGGTPLVEQPHLLEQVTAAYPRAQLLGCSTAGEIFNTQVTDDHLVVTAVAFEKTQIMGFDVQLAQAKGSYQAGRELARQLSRPDLQHIFVLSDGLQINGSELVAGFLDHLPAQVTLTGGLAGDGDRFTSTFVVWNGQQMKDTVVALGFYGQHLKIGYGSLGGWDAFGPERLITKAKGNVLYELDGRNALDLYKKYLGDHAQQLPASGLLFPLSICTSCDEPSVVRTILAVNETDQSLIFAGDIPEGGYSRLMKANLDRLIEGAISAAEISQQAMPATAPELAILISCVGRKLVLKQRVEEEIEGVRETLGKQPVITGFYSYGEISPFAPGKKCSLHNQTMTITTFFEE